MELLCRPLEAIMPKCPLALAGDKEMEEWENWARNQLMAAGSDLLGKLSNLQVSVQILSLELTL